MRRIRCSAAVAMSKHLEVGPIDALNIDHNEFSVCFA